MARMESAQISESIDDCVENSQNMSMLSKVEVNHNTSIDAGKVLRNNSTSMFLS